MGTTYTHTDKDGDQIEVVTYPDDPAPTILATGQGRWAEVEFTEEDAPALALAILEAAGYENGKGEWGDHISLAISHLKVHANEQAAKKAEAEEAKKLDEEARALCDSTKYGGWDVINDIGKDYWRQIARAARELYGVGK